MIHIYQKHFVSVANRTAITQEGWDEKFVPRKRRQG